jgi:phosphatidylserine/phosphatidylglycerophosphate/cardiolipin synthase-like enzyme
VCLARGAAYIGSHNFFDTSLEDNREVGVVLAVQAGVGVLMIAELETDLAHDTPLGPVYRILQTMGADLPLMMAEAGRGGDGLSA